MAKEHVAKFYEKLAEDAALAEKLNAMDKDFAEKNDGPADDAAMREKAAAAIVIPLAEEIGLPFTIEELKEYEQEQMKNMTISDDELDQVAGGHPGRHGQNGGGLDASNGLNACAYLGVGLGQTKKNGKYAFCIILGGSDGPVAG